MGSHGDKTLTVSRGQAIATAHRILAIPHQRNWRADDPPAKTVGELLPDDLGMRVVIRSKDFLGTVYGTLLAVEPHASLVAFSVVQLYGKKLLTFRNDTEVIVVDDLRPRD